jgi:hypothetical protein
MGADPTKQVIRDWNREIDAELRRQAAREDGRWRILVWVALEAVWLVALFAGLGLLSRAL